VFEVQDQELRRLAINALAEIKTDDSTAALRNVMADQEDPPRIYSPNRSMKLDELERIRAILALRRDKDAIVIKCRNCKVELDVTPAIAGTYVICKNCHNRMLAPSDPTPAACAKRIVDVKDWTGLLEPLSHTKLEQGDLDPWYSEKCRASRDALQAVGEQVIVPIVELIIRKCVQKGYCMDLEDLCSALVGIGDPSAGPYLKIIAANENTLSAHGTTYDKVNAFVAQHGAASCDKDLLSRLASAYGKKQGPLSSDSSKGMSGDWQKISGQDATGLAERAAVARPGTFTAAAIRWTGAGKPPFFVKIAGRIKCAYCGTSTGFSLDGMSGQVRCGGCSAVYSLFNADKEMDGNDYRIIVASVFSHSQGSGVLLPQFDIVDVTASK
jgi:hypothetical protein